MASSVTGNVLPWPSMTMPTESPTNKASMPAPSSSRAIAASYAVSMTIFSRRCFFACRSVIRTLFARIVILHVRTLEHLRERP